MSKELYACSWASGQITFHFTPPKGAIVVARGVPSKVRSLIKATARQGYDGKTIFLPGVPEAEIGKEAFQALCRYTRRIHRRAREGVTL